MTQFARWDIFCQVVDNLGDAGFCWRLAQELSGLGITITLWIDQPEVLPLIGARASPQLHIRSWQETVDYARHAQAPEVLIETFGCTLPPTVREAIERSSRPPLWINLEHLAFVDNRLRTHGLPSPQNRSPLPPLPKWFFVPGWTSGSGGVLREPDILQRQATFDGHRWLDARGWAPRGAEKVVMVFCYAQAPLRHLIEVWSEEPLLVLMAAGTPIDLPQPWPRHVRVIRLPWLSQTEFDELLWSCDFNIVRGEDSLVRACWAAKPFLWQAYPRPDGGHLEDVHGWLDMLKACQAWPNVHTWESHWLHVNGDRRWTAHSPWAVWDSWRDACLKWRQHLTGQTTLVQRLLAFVKQHQITTTVPLG